MKRQIIDLISKMLRETNPDESRNLLVDLYQKIGTPFDIYEYTSGGMSNGDIIKAARDFYSTPNTNNRTHLEEIIREIETET